MKKITNYLKTLLVAAMVMVGSSAWADYDQTNQACNFENSETLFTASGRMTGSNAVDPNNSENHVYSFVSASNAANAAPGGFAYYNFSALTSTAVKVDISFDCYLSETAGQIKVSFGDASQRTSSIFTAKGSWSYSNTGAIFAFGTERGKLDGKNNENYAKVNNTNIGSTTTLKANQVLGLWVSVNATVDITNKTVSYTLKNKSTQAVLVSETDAAFLSDAALACTQLDIQTGVNSCTAYIDNVSITSYTDASEKYANYTVKYMYGETEIKAARIVESIKVGNDATILASDKAAIWYNDEKYIYSSDNVEGKTVAEDGSTVVTVSFRKASVEAYSVNFINSANSDVLVENALSGTVIEGESSTIYYHKAIKIGDDWYVRNQNGGEPYYGMSVTAGTNTLAYTAAPDVKYFFEVEDMDVVTVGSFSGWRNDGLAGRSSNGFAPRHYGKNYAYTEPLAGGVYTLNMNARNQSSSTVDNITLAIMDEEGNITELENQFEDWAKASTAEKTVSVSIPDGAKFVLWRNNENNSNLNMDFLLFTRTGDYTVTKSISAAGYATYCSPYALDFSGSGLTAYIAKVAGGNVTFEAVTRVPANTGVLLKGAEGNYEIPVIASADAVENAFVGVTTETADVPAGIYVLMNGTEGVGFYETKNAFTVGANTAYLPAASSARQFIGFDFNEATAIKAIESVKAENGAFNLRGQRVKNLTKGLYIVNGKKVVK